MRLTVGKYVSKNITNIVERECNVIKSMALKNICEINGKTIDTSYIFLNIPKKIKGKKIKLVEIVPVYKGLKFKINFKYENNEQQQEKKLNGMISIDLGVKNLMTIYDPSAEPTIIRGSVLTSLNYYFNKKLDALHKREGKISIKYKETQLVKHKNTSDSQNII